jgi:UrcA family protein
MKHELSTERGVSRVYKRLEKKARSSCDTTGRKALATRQADQICAAALLDSFVIDLANSSVTEYHERSTQQ